MAQRFANAARGVLASPIAPETTTIEIAEGADLFPVISGEDWFKAVLQDADGIEIIEVYGRTGNVFTVYRGSEGTMPRAFSAGTVVGLRITAEDIEGAIAIAIAAASAGANSVQLTGDQPIWGIKRFNEQVEVGGTLVNHDSIAINAGGFGDRISRIDFHSAGMPHSIDFSARIIRHPGVDGALHIAQTGTGGTTVEGSLTASGNIFAEVDIYAFHNISANGNVTSHGGRFIGDGAVPAGAVMHFAMHWPPTGWLRANGADVSRAAFADLFAAIGTTYGAGDGTTTFQLPDLRGEFLRGFDDGRGVDTFREFGSAQEGTAIEDRLSGSLNAALNINNGEGGHAVTGSYLSDAMGGTTNQTTRHRVRPRNVALLACIKF